MGNHWTSAAPQSRFRQVRLASLVLPNGLASLTDRVERRRAGEEETMVEIADPETYRTRLAQLFGIGLTAEEVAALGLF
jgi:N-hydroxyarylamine O-acetyltransferase